MGLRDIDDVTSALQDHVGDWGTPVLVELPDGSKWSIDSTRMEDTHVVLTLEAQNQLGIPDQAKMWKKKTERAERKAAEANRQNVLLRDKVRDLTLRNFALQRIMDNPSTLSGYMVRYEKAREALNIIRDIVTRGESGLPVEEPERLHPVEVPEYLRVKPEEV